MACMSVDTSGDRAEPLEADVDPHVELIVARDDEPPDGHGDERPLLADVRAWVVSLLQR